MIEFVIIGFLLYIIGLWGVLVIRFNLLIVLMSIEMMLLGISITFIGYSLVLDDLLGQIFCLFILTIAAAESALGLAIMVVYYRIRGLLELDLISSLKGG